MNKTTFPGVNKALADLNRNANRKFVIKTALVGTATLVGIVVGMKMLNKIADNTPLED